MVKVKPVTKVIQQIYMTQKITRVRPK